MIRSFLFVPGDSERKLEKAGEVGADAIIVDLEDSVTAESRPRARELAREGFEVATSTMSGWVRSGAGLLSIVARAVRSDLLLYTNAFLLFVGIACWVWGRFATLQQSIGRRVGMQDFDPTIIAFICNWCKYTAADLAGTSRLHSGQITRTRRWASTATREEATR